MRLILTFLWLWVAIIATCIWAIGCAPGRPFDPDTPEIVFVGATTAEVELGLRLWEEIKVCTGYDGRRTSNFEISVYDAPLLCGNPVGPAAGCQYPDHIDVVRTYFENALAHEFIHYCMSMQGKPPDFNHEDPVWGKCDWRNR